MMDELHPEALALAWVLSAAGHELRYTEAHKRLWWITSKWTRVEVALELDVERELVDWEWIDVVQWKLRVWNDDVMIHATAPEGRLSAVLGALGAMEVRR